MVTLDVKCPVCGKTLIVFVADNRSSIRCDNCQLYSQADNPEVCAMVFNRMAARRRVNNILKGLKHKNVSTDGKR